MAATCRILFIDDDIIPGDLDTDCGDEGESLGGAMGYYIQEFRDHGYFVCTAIDPDSALLAVGSDGPFHVAVVDVMLPPGNAFEAEDTSEGTLTGFKLARRLHDLDPRMIIVGISNIKDSSVAASLDEVRRDGVLAALIYKKQYTPKSLREAVEKLLSRKSL